MSLSIHLEIKKSILGVKDIVKMEESYYYPWIRFKEYRKYSSFVFPVGQESLWKLVRIIFLLCLRCELYLWVTNIFIHMKFYYKFLTCILFLLTQVQKNKKFIIFIIIFQTKNIIRKICQEMSEKNLKSIMDL